MTTTDSLGPESSKHQFLVALYQSFWTEMMWRRTAGYRTIILGLAYCTALLTAVAFHPQMALTIRYTLAGVLVIGTLFGAGYLASNYKKYMTAAAKIVAIEDFMGAFRDDFLGSLGPLNPAARRDWPQTPLSRDMVSLWSILAFLAGGLLTAAAIALV